MPINSKLTTHNSKLITHNYPHSVLKLFTGFAKAALTV